MMLRDTPLGMIGTVMLRMLLLLKSLILKLRILKFLGPQWMLLKLLHNSGICLWGCVVALSLQVPASMCLEYSRNWGILIPRRHGFVSPISSPKYSTASCCSYKA